MPIRQAKHIFQDIFNLPKVSRGETQRQLLNFFTSLLQNPYKSKRFIDEYEPGRFVE